ncbi:MAG TPA: ATP-binding protein [Vicinamibacteria bacterium]|nr:ATP-binding protein [Vicinamibacteria bacterium]
MPSEPVADEAARARAALALVSHVPMGLWASGIDGGLLVTSTWWEGFTGPCGERPQAWEAWIHPDDVGRVARARREAMAARRPFELDYRLRRADGAYRDIHEIGVPCGSGPDHTGYAGWAVDVTEARQAEREKDRLLAEAEAASQAKDRFLATLSHALRTPLNAILGWASMLRTGRLDEETAGRAAETIERNARAQGRLIADLLDVSRIVSGRLRLAVQAVDVASVVEGAVESLRPLAEERGVRLQVVLDTGGLVSGDPDRLHEVAANLVHNAIRHTPRGGRVSVTVARSRSSIELRVEDDGEGLEPERLATLFSPPPRPGSGLGLSIVRHLVELHGGTVSAWSAGPGRGARLTVRLPQMIVADAEAGTHPAAEARTPVLEAPSLAGTMVLAVDDEPDARALITAVLEQHGARVVVAASAAEALRLLDRERPDVLVSDVEMPGEDGYALIRRVRERSPEKGGDIPAAALTAHAGMQDRIRALLAGFQIHLAKPVQPVELAAVVASLAGNLSGGRS